VAATVAHADYLLIHEGGSWDLETVLRATRERVSPNFMNTRALADGQRSVPQLAPRSGAGRAPEIRAEEVAFDVAKEAASVEELRKALESIDKELADLKSGEGIGGEAARERLEDRKTRLAAELEAAEARRASGQHKA
jgi:hypothetical protein